MNRRKPTYFRNSLDLRDKVQVKVLRKRLKLSDEQFADIVRKSGNSISAITKEATRTTTASPSELPVAVTL
jgi:DNA-binding transcriptional regulator YiaG